MSTRKLQIHAAIGGLQRLSELFQKRRALLAESSGLTETQWEVLEEISTEHFMPSMFARQRSSSAAAVSKTLRQLSDKGLVTVSLSEQDARHRNYTLTQEARRVMAELREQRLDAIERVWMTLDPALIQNFNVFCDQLTPRLEALLTESKSNHGSLASREQQPNSENNNGPNPV